MAIFFLHLRSQAQRQEIDSLQEIVQRKIDNDTANIHTLNRLAMAYGSMNTDSMLLWAEKALLLSNKIKYEIGAVDAMRHTGYAYFVKGEYTKAMDNYMEAMEIAKKIKYKKGVGKLYNNIALVYQSKGFYDSALVQYSISIHILEEVGDKKGVAACLNNIANVYEFKGQYAKSLENHFKSLKIREAIHDNLGIAASLNNIGIVYQMQGNYAESLKSHLQALKIRETTQDKIGIASSFTNIGIIQEAQGKFLEAKEYYQKSLALNKEIGDKHGEANCLNNIGIIYENLERYPEALDCYAQSLKIREEIGDRRGIASSLNNIGVIYCNQGKYQDAVTILNKSLDISREIGNKQEIANTNYALSRAYMELKNYPLALKTAKEGLGIASQIGKKVLIRDGNYNLSRIYKDMGNFVQALEHFEIFFEYSDSLNNLETQSKTEYLKAEYEFDKKTNLLKAEQQKKYANLEREKNQSYWIIFSAFLIIAFCILIMAITFNSRRKLKKAYIELEISNANLLKAKMEMEDQADELLKLNQFKDNLFSIIAHDLRGPMANLQSTISLLDSGLLNKDDLAKIKTELTLRFQTTDRVLQDLLEWTKHQMLGEKLDIQYVNMHDVVEEKITLHGTFIKNKKIKVQNRIKAEDHALVDKTHIKIIIQNLLSNAIKFSYPEGIITIKSQIIDKMIKISVEDNGKGISEEQINNLFEIQYATTTGTAGEKGNGLGLHLVKLLVEKNNGKIGVASEVGKGSEFYFLLPCKE